jgi:hypothetical protein
MVHADTVSNVWPFPMGEVLTYQLQWGPVPVGSSRITTDWEIVDGKPLWVVRFTARSNKALAAIYPVHDELVSYIDPATFLPIRLIKKTREGNVYGDDELIFNHAKKTARWIDRIKKRTIEYPIETNTHGLVSFLYWLRTQPMNPGDVRKTQIAVDDRLQNFTIKALKNQNIRLDGFGVMPSVLLNVSVSTNDFFVRKIPGRVWVSADSRRVVTQMYIKVPIGHIRVFLTSIQEPGYALSPNRRFAISREVESP